MYFTLRYPCCPEESCGDQGESRTTRCPHEAFAKCHLNQLFRIPWFVEVILSHLKNVLQRRWVSYHQAVFL
jgi:hypothetical protein